MNVQVLKKIEVVLKYTFKKIYETEQMFYIFYLLLKSEKSPSHQPLKKKRRA